MLIVGDVAGQYDALRRLVDPFLGKMKIVLVGDLVDRGPKSKEVVQFAIDNEQNGVTALLGNHEHMMIDWFRHRYVQDYDRIYAADDWILNGGLATLRSYGVHYTYTKHDFPKEMATHVQWLSKRPVNHRVGNIMCSHAPITAPTLDMIGSFEHALPFWNRREPTPTPNLNVFGHNSNWGYRPFSDDKGRLYALCIDTSRQKELTGIEIDEDGDFSQFPHHKVHAVQFGDEPKSIDL